MAYITAYLFLTGRHSPPSLVHLRTVTDDDALLVPAPGPGIQKHSHPTHLVGVQRRIDLIRQVRRQMRGMEISIRVVVNTALLSSWRCTSRTKTRDGDTKNNKTLRCPPPPKGHHVVSKNKCHVYIATVAWINPRHAYAQQHTSGLKVIAGQQQTKATTSTTISRFCAVQSVILQTRRGKQTQHSTYVRQL